jgi:hypothetical protein
MPSRKSPASASRGANAIECTSPSRPAPLALERVEQRADVGVARDVARQHRAGAEIGRELDDAVLEAVVDVGERERRAFALARARDAVRDRAVRQHARDEDPAVGEETHGYWNASMNERMPPSAPQSTTALGTSGTSAGAALSPA